MKWWWQNDTVVLIVLSCLPPLWTECFLCFQEILNKRIILIHLQCHYCGRKPGSAFILNKLAVHNSKEASFLESVSWCKLPFVLESMKTVKCVCNLGLSSLIVIKEPFVIILKCKLGEERGKIITDCVFHIFRKKRILPKLNSLGSFEHSVWETKMTAWLIIEFYFMQQITYKLLSEAFRKLQ